MDKETRFLDVELRDEEILAFGQEQAKLLKEVSELKEKKSELQRQINPKAKRIGELAECIDTGIENREVSCEWNYNWGGGTKVLRRLDTGEAVENKEITLADRQFRMEGA